MRIPTITAAIACLALAGCAPIIWDKPGITQAGFDQDNARCRLIARGMNPGAFYAQGTPQFVAGAAAGNAVATAVNQRETYRDCMVLQGYTERGSATVAADTSPGAGSSGSPRYGGGGPSEPNKIKGGVE
jgi:hypothetical protein